MKPFMFLIRAVTMIAVYALSLHVLKSSSAYAFLDKYLELPLGTDLVLTAAAFFMVLIFITDKKAVFNVFYFICIIFYLSAALSYARLDWLKLIFWDNLGINYQTTLSETNLAFYGSLIVAGYLVITYTDYIEKTAANFSSRGIPSREINHIFIKQSTSFILLIIIVTAIAAFFINSIAKIESSMESIIFYLLENPSAIAVSGIFILLLLGLLVIWENRSSHEKARTETNHKKTGDRG